jgi:hypothetical protein
MALAMSFNKIVLPVFGCATIPRYKEEILKIKDTWGNLMDTSGNEWNPSSVKILFFLGEEKVVDLQDENYIYLPNVKNDYLSASYKQHLGLKYIYDNYTCSYVLCCGTDTFINIPKLVNLLSEFNSKDYVYIGGHGDYRKIYNTPYFFHSGGPGFIISFPCLQKIYPYLENITDIWITICKESNINELNTACDVAISYFLQLLVKPEVIKLNTMFTNCNYKGYPCHFNQINMREIIACHNMSLTDFDDFYDILRKNNYFIDKSSMV